MGATARSAVSAEMEPSMAKLIQICASANDLFGLDDEGTVYHYNFNTEGWVRLGRGSASDGASERDESLSGLKKSAP
jgi:hypothetical protein